MAGSPNVIGNQDDVDRGEIPVNSMAGLNVDAASFVSREKGHVPKSLQGSVRTRRERKSDYLMSEAGQRTQEALQTREGP